MLGRVGDVIVAKGGHKVVRVVVALQLACQTRSVKGGKEWPSTSLLVSQRQAGQAGLLDGGLEVFGEQLFLLVEIIRRSLGTVSTAQKVGFGEKKGGGGFSTDHVDQHLQVALLPSFDQLGGVVVLPRSAVLAQVAGERLLAPGAVAGVGDGREGADAAVQVRVA